MKSRRKPLQKVQGYKEETETKESAKNRTPKEFWRKPYWTKQLVYEDDSVL